ncbi:hypothetical protein K474DRAFT_1671495 [Panus rudis PR-1116 ss-1]|nr:hypothetical protein K474DRAFT_1671495 [Panus rudis PR-1116 ss-1]
MHAVFGRAAPPHNPLAGCGAPPVKASPQPQPCCGPEEAATLLPIERRTGPTGFRLSDRQATRRKAVGDATSSQVAYWLHIRRISPRKGRFEGSELEEKRDEIGM